MNQIMCGSQGRARTWAKWNKLTLSICLNTSEWGGRDNTFLVCKEWRRRMEFFYLKCPSDKTAYMSYKYNKDLVFDYSDEYLSMKETLSDA